jgi:O-methyltransferase domain
VFDHVGRNCSKPVEAVAAGIGADEKLLYRLMRALASLGLLVEDESRGFAASEAGELLRSDHPQSLRHRVLVTDGPEHYAIWKHLPDIIRDGKQDGFIREFGARAFEYAQTNSRYRRTFDQGMTGYSVAQSDLVLEALRDYDFSKIRTVCDIGGGRGHLICALLKGTTASLGACRGFAGSFRRPKSVVGEQAKVRGSLQVCSRRYVQASPTSRCLHPQDDLARLGRSGVHQNSIQSKRRWVSGGAGVCHRTHRAGSARGPFCKAV